MLHRVRLYCEQEALAEVEAPDDATLDELRELALEAVDRGEARFETIAGWAEKGWGDSPHHAPTRGRRPGIAEEIRRAVEGTRP